MRPRGPLLAAAAGLVLLGAACRSGADGNKPAAAHPPEGGETASDQDPSLIKGPFANAVRVSERGFILEDTSPPPRDDGDSGSLSLDGDDDDEMKVPGRGGGGSKRKRFGQSPLYLDGVGIAVVAYGELPAWLPTRPEKLSDGRSVTRFRLAEYFEALGVPVGKIQAVHFYGGRGRVAIIPGDELRRIKDELLFSFTAGDAGKMRMHWDSKFDVSDTIDKVQAVALYVDKAPPRWDRAKWGLVDERGERIEGIPYAAEPMRGGVRLYLDGRIAHVLKRNRTFDRKIAPHRIVDGVPYFRLFEYLEEEELKAGAVAAVELLQENAVVLRLEGAALAAERETLEMSAPPQAGGQVTIHLGPQEARRSVSVTSVNLYTAARLRPTYRRD
jgi:hypothetical protein